MTVYNPSVHFCEYEMKRSQVAKVLMRFVARVTTNPRAESNLYVASKRALSLIIIAKHNFFDGRHWNSGLDL